MNWHYHGCFCAGLLPAGIVSADDKQGIAAWQAAHNLTADGDIGLATADAMHFAWLATAPAGHLTPHFTVAEFSGFTAAEKAAGKQIPAELMMSVRATARLAEIVRFSLFGGVPCEVVAGYRSTEYNDLCGGEKASKHMLGQAVDIRPVSFVGQDPWTWRKSVDAMINAGQLPNGGNHVYLDHKRPFLHVDHRAGAARWSLDDEALPRRAIA